MNAPVRVGILALQGGVREHANTCESLGAQVILVRRPRELAQVEALVLPGGESSMIDKLSRAFDLQKPIQAAIAAGLPVYGTCAGLILLADRICDGIEGQQTFGSLDVTVRRNAFGSQIDSFESDLHAPDLGEEPVRAVFIRAPIVAEVGPAARSLATLPGGEVVAVEQGNLLGTSFHPELTGETRFHARLMDKARARRG
ncbi:pyridoxal 5'-phosphate synthase glutaminase subunit PdxT [Brevibacterium paucivorans]|uniref:Pyridoxal 5'-phosphate synthase subunit PdxT n=1 Tax=Brevibacterium paucivorans TaxID=170994 RepID=A0A2N6VQQ2_9MICO|nr:pyridoxal 5'-phosphate synthase glutaminase subunit PdxT [Brevibacterium paucivorans]PMD06471.1 pyridoxal 5'-phosphate synthase glutaminase subunit PdxT [Brevibacterium paucivorans]